MSKSLLQTLYLKARWVKDPQAQPGQFDMMKLSDDALIMVIKDDETNSSEIKIIERPTIEFYTIKDPDSCKPYNEMYIKKDLVDTHVVEFSKRDAEICKYLGIYDEYQNLKREANKRHFDFEDSKRARDNFKNFMNETVYKSPLIYGADVGIEEYYRTKFMLEHGDKTPKVLNISFYDIETYIYHFKTQVDQNNPEAPINIITYYNSKYKHFYCLILNIEEIKDIEVVKANLSSYIQEYILEDFKDDPEIKLNFEFYDSEILLIKRFHELINKDKPDFALAWNDNYDKKYIMGRERIHGLNIAQEWCHPDIPEQYRQMNFVEDGQRKEKGFNPGAKNKKHHSRLWDKTLVSGYTLFSNLRKRNIENSYKLDAIAEKIIHANKVDLHEFGLTIRNAPFKDFKTFLKYSCRDTRLISLIEDKDKDLQNYISLTENSDIWAGVNVSIVIKNAFYKRFCENGYVIGNTVDYGVKESIDGALVQDPLLVDAPSVEINGKKTKLFRNVVDWDAKSLYPSLMCQHKIGKENQRYRILNITDINGKFIMTGQDFNQFLQTQDVSIIELCNQLYGLPHINEIFSDFERCIFKACGNEYYGDRLSDIELENIKKMEKAS